MLTYRFITVLTLVVDNARARPQREQRGLSAQQRLHPHLQQGQDHQDVGGGYRLLRQDLHRTQVPI